MEISREEYLELVRRVERLEDRAGIAQLEPAAEQTFPIGLVIGHTEDEKGARSPTLDAQEYDVWDKWVTEQLVPRMSRHGLFPLWRYRDGGGIQAAYASLSEHKPLFTIEFHFNAFDDPTVGGATCLWPKAEGKAADFPRGGVRESLSRDLAEKLTDLAAETLNIRRRDTMPVVYGKNRGAASVTQLPCPQVLWEPFFGSNPNDASAFLTRYETLAERMAMLLKAFAFANHDLLITKW